MSDRRTLLDGALAPPRASRGAAAWGRVLGCVAALAVVGGLAAFVVVLALQEARQGKSDGADVAEPSASLSACASELAPFVEALRQSPLAGERIWSDLAEMSDEIGPRLSGSPELERAIDWVAAKMTADGLEKVRKEPVTVPRWVRGPESLRLDSPRVTSMSILGLGNSVSTPGAAPLSAQVMVVESFDDLAANCSAAVGRIVLYAWPRWVSYGTTGRFRREGASEAARCGAVAALVKSITPFSLYTPHTGVMTYAHGVEQIPAAAVTVEDADMMTRMARRGKNVSVTLLMSATFPQPDAISHNVMGEVTGSDPSAGVVVFGGHIDSWDVGGALDDAGGVFAAWAAVRTLISLGMRARATIRVVGWTDEERGGRGGEAYRVAHANETTIFALESDSGATAPLGIGFTGPDEMRTELQRIGEALVANGLPAGEVFPSGGGADIAPLMADGVPGAGLRVDDSRYFWYHHTRADVPGALEPTELADCAATMGAFAWCVANAPPLGPASAASAPTPQALIM